MIAAGTHRGLIPVLLTPRAPSANAAATAARPHALWQLAHSFLPLPPSAARVGARPPQSRRQREEGQGQGEVPDAFVRRSARHGEQKPQRETRAREEQNKDLNRRVRQKNPGSESRFVFADRHEGDGYWGQEAPGREQDDAVDLMGNGERERETERERERARERERKEGKGT